MSQKVLIKIICFGETSSRFAHSATVRATNANLTLVCGSCKSLGLPFAGISSAAPFTAVAPSGWPTVATCW